MLKRNVKKKILAMVLIFTLTFAKLAYVTEAMATSIFNTVFNLELGTGHENVEFEAYFDVDGQKENTIVSDVNNKELAIKVQVDVLEYGYLKHAKVELVEAEEGNGLNFKVRDFEELPVNLQNAENNVFEFKQINDYDEISELVIPIDYKNEEYINENKLTSENIVRFTGTYVDDEGEEVEVSRDVSLRVTWKDSREAKVTSTVEKYIDFKNGEARGVILQTLVKVDNTAEGNTLPVKSTEVTVEVPRINEVAPSRVEVIALSTMGTNGKFAENVVFGTDNWSYDSVTNMFEAGKTPEDILEIILGDQNLEINEKIDTKFDCNCSKDRVAKALISIGKEEIQSMIDEGNDIVLNCHFCNTNYTFTVDELKELYEQSK